MDIQKANDIVRMNKSEILVGNVHISTHGSGEESYMEIVKSQKILLPYEAWKKLQGYKDEIEKFIRESPHNAEYKLSDELKLIITQRDNNSLFKMIHLVYQNGLYSEMMSLDSMQWFMFKDVYLRGTLLTPKFPEHWEYNLSEIKIFRWTIQGVKSSSWYLSMEDLMQDFDMRTNRNSILEQKSLQIPKASELLLWCYQKRLLSYECLGCCTDGETNVNDHTPGCLSPIENVSDSEISRYKKHLKSHIILRSYNKIRQHLGLTFNLTLNNFDLMAYCQDHKFLTGIPPYIFFHFYYC